MGLDGSILKPLEFDGLPHWRLDDHKAAFDAFLVGAVRMVEQPYKTRALGVDGDALQRVAKKALAENASDASSARVFFEQNFVPHQVETNENQTGFLTGFFEPLVAASRTKTDRFQHPLYCRPPDLIDLDDTNRPDGMDPYFRFGRLGKQGIEPYHDRASIQSGAMEGEGLELVWLKNKVDAFFIHVQGAAKLELEDGSLMRVTYAAKSGHPYTSAAKILCAEQGVAPETMTADHLADWMHAHPERVDDLLAHNQSYIFFKAVEGQSPDQGPIAAAKVPLVAGRSMAVDRSLHTFGTPIWLTTPEPLPESERPLARLMMAHDTGSAIVGAGRGDIFTGTGRDAGHVAGRVRHAAQLTVLVPNS